MKSSLKITIALAFGLASTPVGAQSSSFQEKREQQAYKCLKELHKEGIDNGFVRSGSDYIFGIANFHVDVRREAYKQYRSCYIKGLKINLSNLSLKS